METLQELADTLQTIDNAQALSRARSASNPFARIQNKAGLASAKAVATALSQATTAAELWSILRFHRKMTGEDLFAWFEADTFRLWTTDAHEPCVFTDLGDLSDRARDWLKRRFG